MSFKRVFISAVAGLTFSSTVLALGLGTIERDSWLNQPLSARIPLHSADTVSLEALQVTMASQETFERAGLDRPPYLRDIRFEVIEDHTEGPHIRVYTRDPFREPFVDFLVELNWPQGRLVREYTLLLDPPRDPAERPVAATPPRTEPAEVEEQPLETASPTVRDGHYGPVAGGETLWSVADRVRHQGVSAQQMALALFEANPRAFVANDINRLQAGATLTVPDAEGARAYSRNEAVRRFNALAEGVAEEPAEEPPVAEAPDPETVDRQLQILAESERDEEALASLLDGDVEPSEENLGALREELLRAREDQASLRSENEALRERVSEMAQEIERLERLLTLDVETGVLPMVPSEQPEGAVAEPPPERPAVVDEPEVEPEITEETPAEDDEAPVTAPPPAPSSPQPLAWLDGLSLPVALAGVGILIGLLALLLIRRRRTETGVAAEEVPIQQPPAREGVAAGTAAAASAVADGDEPEPEPAPEPRSEPQDPLQVADELADRGDLEGARATLLTALNNVPARNEYRVRLLEILAEADDREGFDRQAQVLRERVEGEDDPLWRQAERVGRGYAPDNPLFGGADPDGADDGGAEATGGALPTLDESAPGGADLAEPAEEPAREGEAFDFTLDFPEPDEPGRETDQVARQGASRETAAPETPATPAGEEGAAGGEGGDFTLDFEVDDSWREAADSRPAADAGESPGDEAFDLDLGDLTLDESGAGDATGEERGGGEPSPGEAPDADQPPAPPAEAPMEDAGGDEEIATKLDLARAYVDLGDPDGARELLNEVLEVGTPAQQEEARKLLGDL
ncbi:FimV/HubP family polar landmark protein [Alkalilimnicola ehrlichii MLHE-1]|uniref:Putative membrane protein K07288 uncharacterized membrane protein n=1 Tax=Alkalilimnicola ehrlichii (strain ATCC BAA-1101 / DSM 17681 / MLHE-1) TaxID=187272 RepID=Q0A9A6_ALKEH|nr:FimV/HubP family polar landmark protein [Alkalilimnicola ehrlichii]ABI56581.1 putative membrane protein; K07288 uncharacterized membrane protein [Alkalilimnicola ehrlichii MLHE-1]